MYALAVLGTNRHNGPRGTNAATASVIINWDGVMRADKAKVINEIWDDARIESFLNKEPMGDEPAEFSQLLFAYRSMRVGDFELFLQRFKDAGGDINTTNKAGQRLRDIVASHQKSADFLALLDD